MREFFYVLRNKNLAQVLWEKYLAIDVIFRQSFWITFISLNLVFGFFNIHFLWGNHDWMFVGGDGNLFYQLYNGRWSINFLSGLLLDEKMVLPILTCEMAFFGLSMTAVLFCKLLEIEKKISLYLVICLLLTLQPFTYTRMYYMFELGGQYTSAMFVMIAFLIAKYQSNVSKSVLSNLFLTLLSAFLFHFAIATYGSFINTIAMLVCVILLLSLINQNSLKNVIVKNKFVLINTFLGVVSYKITLSLLIQFKISHIFYNNETIGLKELPERIVLATKTAFSNLVSYDFPFMPSFITLTFLAIFVLFIILLLFSKLNLLQKFSVVLLLVCAMIFTQSNILLGKTVSILPRIDFYGLLFFRVAIVALIFKIGLNLSKNLVFILVAPLLFVCVINDIKAQRTQKLAFEAEKMYWNRILMRIEALPNFSYNKRYTGVMFGYMPNMRTRYYKENKRVSWSLLNSGYTSDWQPFYQFSFYLQQNIFKQGFHSNIHKNHTGFKQAVARLKRGGVLDRLNEYPSKDSVVIFEDIIVFVPSKGNLDQIKKDIGEAR